MSDESSGKFRLGEAYYECHEHFGTIIVNTWTFCGLNESDCSSTSCDVPYHFYEFRIRQGEVDTGWKVRVPSLKQAEQRYLSWDEFCTKFEKLKFQRTKS
jgi:hypothetical protein